VSEPIAQEPVGSLANTISPSLRVVITLAVLSATLMEVLDTSIVNVALPNMQGELGATLDEIGWVSTGYIISNVIVLPLTGWLSDYFGRKRYLTYSVLLFTAASFACGASRTLTQLVVFRVIQGAGGAAFLSTAQATLIEIYPKRLQGFAQAMFGIGVIMAPTLGPSLGGFLTDRYSWPFIFFVNIPVGIVATVLTALYVPDSRAAGEKRRVDFIGIGLLAVGLGSLQTVLERGQRDDWLDSTFICIMSALAVSGLALFIWWELRAGNKSPAVNLHLLRNRNLGAGAIYAFGLGFILYGTVFALPQFWQTIQPHSAEQTGILLIPGGLASAFMMPIVGQLVGRIDRRLLVGSGMLCIVFSMWQFSARFTAGTPDEQFFWPLVLRGAGLGLQFVPLSLIALGTLPPRDVAQGAGLYNLFRQLGGSVGIAFLTTIYTRLQQFHYEILIRNLTPTTAALQTRLAQLQSGFVARGSDAVSAEGSALRALFGTIQREAALAGFVDMFRLIAYFGIGSLFLLLMFKRTKGGASASIH
jgi:DHA2 family multidrug resistance protein